MTWRKGFLRKANLVTIFTTVVSKKQSLLNGVEAGNANPRDIRPEDYEMIDSLSDKLRHLINYAILAPSTHNTQPWLFRVSDKSIEVLADRSRALAVIDPDDKGLAISCGAASGMLAIALSAVGFQFHVAHLPDSYEPDLVSRFRITDQVKPEADWKDTLTKIRLRRSVRAGFKNEALSDSSLLHLQLPERYDDCHQKWVDSVEQEKHVLDAILKTEKDRQFDKHYLRENASWINPIRVRSRDGIPANVGKMPSLS